MIVLFIDVVLRGELLLNFIGLWFRDVIVNVTTMTFWVNNIDDELEM